MRRLIWIPLVIVMVLAGCTRDPGPDPTIPPVKPSHKITGSVLPYSIAGYTALGPTPAPEQMSVTYARDTQPLDLVVVSFDLTGDYGRTELSGQQWYGPSRCGILWKGDQDATPPVQQVACITVLTDGVMTAVTGGQQTVGDLALLVNAIHDTLA